MTDTMQDLAKGIDAILNWKEGEPQTGFCLLVFGLNAPGIANYVSKAPAGGTPEAGVASTGYP